MISGKTIGLAGPHRCHGTELSALSSEIRTDSFMETWPPMTPNSVIDWMGNRVPSRIASCLASSSPKGV